MIITLSGEAGSGKSTCAKGIAQTFQIKHYSSGDLMRQMASERNLSLAELSALAEKDPSIDRELDERQIRLGKTEDQFIIDGRLSAHFIPHALKIFITATLEERGKRIFSARRAEESFDSLEKTLEAIRQRKESEIKRYMAWYDFNPYDPKEYDIVYDTTGKAIPEMIHELKNLVEKRGFSGKSK